MSQGLDASLRLIERAIDREVAKHGLVGYDLLMERLQERLATKYHLLETPHVPTNADATAARTLSGLWRTPPPRPATKARAR